MLLAELNVTKIGTWKDRVGHVVWQDTDDVAWAAGNILFVSLEGFVGDVYWDDYVATLTPPQYQMAESYGGYCRMGFGAILLSLEAFDTSTLWVPPVSFDVIFYYTGTTEGAKEVLFAGVAQLAEMDRTTCTYDLYGEALDAELLLEETNYDGDSVPLPRGLGTAQHRQPVRLADVGGKPTYHKAYLAGTKGVDWHVFDDGVNIDSSVTDNGDGTFSLSAGPVGEVTVSGVGEDSTLSDIAEWACDPARLNLNYDNTKAESPSPAVNWWASSQRVLVEFLSDLAATRTHMFYVRDETLYLIDMDVDNGSRALTEGDIFEPQYDYEPPVAMITAKWQKREAVEETIGKYIKDIKHETSQSSGYRHGREWDMEMFHDVTAVIDVLLGDILTIVHKPRVRVPLPLLGSLPAPGEAISYTDESMVRDMTVSFRCRNVTYDFDNDEVFVEGEGALS